MAAPSAALIVAVFAVLLSDAFSDPVREASSGVGLLLAGIVTATSCGMRATMTRGRRRRSWLLLMLAGVLAVLGNIWVSVASSDPVASPGLVAEVSIALALLLSIAGLLNFPSVRRRGLELLVISLDGLVAAVAMMIIASVLVYSQLLDANAGRGVPTLTLLFPVLDVVLATVALLLVLRAGRTDRPVLSLVAAGFIMYAVADLAFSVLAEEERFRFGTPLDLGWIAGYLLIGLAAWVPSDLVDEPSDRREGGPSDARGTLMVFAVLLVAVIVQFGFGTSGRLQVAQSILWLVLIVVAGARQTLLVADNTALRRGLERRVREQTTDLRRLARRTEVLLTSVGDGIYGVDHEGRVTFVNPSGAEALGFPAEALHGRHAHDTFHAPGEDGLPFPWQGCYVEEAIHHGIVAIAEEDTYVRADGATFPVEITASPVVEEDELRGAVVVFRDVTQRREVDRMKNEFLSVVSHELRTPLTAIRGSLGLLAGGKLGELTPRGGSMVTMALQSTERLTRLINDLLDLERIESGNRQVELSALEASRLLAAVAHQLEGLAAAEGVSVRVDASGGRVLADEDGVMQTLTNLLGNAIKFSEPGGEVVVDARQQGDLVLFRVRDEGRGIPSDKLESIFGRFEQVDSSDTRQKGGTGLGLAISRTIVERLGGRIWAESELGVGTTLSFTLPAAPHHAPATPPSPGPGARVLLVTADEDGAGLLAGVLAERGLTVSRAGSAGEAAELARELDPRVVVLDLPHPGADAGAAAAELRRPGGAAAGAGLVVHTSADTLDPPLQLEHWAGQPVYLARGRTTAAELGDRVLLMASGPTPDPAARPGGILT